MGLLDLHAWAFPSLHSPSGSPGDFLQNSNKKLPFESAVTFLY